MRTVIGLGLIAMLGSCTDPLIADAEKTVRNHLRDPESAQFSDVEKCDKPNAVTGKINAKNGYGGYSGAVPFYYVNGDVAMLGGDAATSADSSEHFNALGRQCFSDKILNETDAITGNDADVDAAVNAAMH